MSAKNVAVPKFLKFNHIQKTSNLKKNNKYSGIFSNSAPCGALKHTSFTYPSFYLTFSEPLSEGRAVTASDFVPSSSIARNISHYTHYFFFYCCSYIVSFTENLIIPHLIKIPPPNPPNFMEPRSSLPCLQDPTLDPCTPTQADKSCPNLPSYFFQI